MIWDTENKIVLPKSLKIDVKIVRHFIMTHFNVKEFMKIKLRKDKNTIKK